MKIAAAVCREFNKDFSVEDVELANIEEDEILVEIKACAICHSDLAFWQGKWGGILPAIYGHEASGVVSEVGAHIKHVKKGDRVIVTLIRGCQACYHCHHSRPYYCSGETTTSSRILLQDDRKKPIQQALNVGGFAQAVIVREDQVVTFPSSLSFEVASLIACGVITGFGGAVNSAAITFGETVAIIGLGGVGMNAVQGAKAAGAGTIIAVDTEDHKCLLSKKFGATHTINAFHNDIEKEIKSLTNHVGADCVIVCVGNPKVMSDAVHYLRAGGRLVLLGMPETGAEMILDPSYVASMGWQIIGSKMGSTQVQRDIPKLIKHYEDKKLLLDELISHCYSINDINTACAEVLSQKTMRNIIVF